MPCSPTDPPPIPVTLSPRSAPTPPNPLPYARSRLISACNQDFAATPTAAAWARRHTADVLSTWRAAELADDACLVVSELVGNAVRHTAVPGSPPSACRLVLKLFDNELAVEVTDPSPGQVARQDQLDQLSESGRGLMIVEAVCGAPVIVFDDPLVGRTVVAVMPRPLSDTA